MQLTHRDVSCFSGVNAGIAAWGSAGDQRWTRRRKDEIRGGRRRGRGVLGGRWRRGNGGSGGWRKLRGEERHS